MGSFAIPAQQNEQQTGGVLDILNILQRISSADRDLADFRKRYRCSCEE